MRRTLWLAILAMGLGAAASGQAPPADGGPAVAELEPPRATADDVASSGADPDAQPPAGDLEGSPVAPPPAPPFAPLDANPPATAVSPPLADAATAGAADTVLAAVLDPGSTSGQDLSSRPLTLLEALRWSGDPSRRLWIAQAYWKTSMAQAWVRWAGEAVERLELVAPGGDPHDRAVLDVATAAARADLAEARSLLGVVQQELVDLCRLPITEPLPRPVDRPLATPYQTHFETIFATRIATGRTRAIARTLPARHEALEARAAAVTAAGQATARAEADHAQGKRPIEAVIAAHAALVGQQREFLAAVRAYNLDIAEYAMAVADLSVPDDRFVSMLIGTPVAVAPPATGGPPAAPPASAGPGTTP